MNDFALKYITYNINFMNSNNVTDEPIGTYILKYKFDWSWELKERLKLLNISGHISWGTILGKFISVIVILQTSSEDWQDYKIQIDQIWWNS